MRTRMTLGNSLLAAIAVLSLAGAGSAQATSGPGCLRIVNVAANDVLNVRSRPSAAAPVVEALDPEQHGILHLDRVPDHPLQRQCGDAWLGEGSLRARQRLPMTAARRA
jgi:hypothetical protein